MQNFKWTAEATETLVRNYPTLTLDELALLLGVPKAKIKAKAHKMGLRKNCETLKRIQVCNAYRNITGLRTDKAKEKQRQGILDMIRRERVRLKYGLRRTNERNLSILPKAEIRRNAQKRYYLRSRGYTINDKEMKIYYRKGETRRNERMERRFAECGYTIEETK
jgi:hypothetical protein